MRLPYGRHSREKSHTFGSWPLESTSNANTTDINIHGNRAYDEEHITSLGTILHLFFRSLEELQSFLTSCCCWTGLRTMISEQTVLSLAMFNLFSLNFHWQQKAPRALLNKGEYARGFLVYLALGLSKKKCEANGHWKIICSFTWKSQMDPKKRFPREDKSISLMADVKIAPRKR